MLNCGSELRDSPNSKQRMKRLILYDLDGTLVDTQEDIVRAANQMLMEMGAPLLAKEEIIRLVGRGLRQLVADCLRSQISERVEEGMRFYRAYYAQHLLDHSRLYAGALEVLDYFRERKQAVVTNKPNPFSREILVGLGVADYFVEIIAGDSDYPRKPDPTSIVSMMEKYRIPPQETLLVGDSPIDVEAGRNAGIQTVVVKHGFADEAQIQTATPDFTVANLEALIPLSRVQGW